VTPQDWVRRERERKSEEGEKGGRWKEEEKID
jgi:hypothetical protein